jgi:beta-galactosidase
MYVGVDYYPEHWPAERMGVDIDLMQKAGFNVVRLAEFDWARMEPERGRFDFAFWDGVLDALRLGGISAIMCTPTASMPAWVAKDYPECCALQPDGQRQFHGTRKTNCFSSATFRELSREITKEMAGHFSGHPAVIGWQVDNELGHPLCYCDSCKASFQGWLRERYGALEALENAWGARFWGHSYRHWSDIEIPRNLKRGNPGALLDWRRHYSHLNKVFLEEQAAILRERCPGHFVTHNFMDAGWQEVNYYDLAKCLDFASWDNYPLGNVVKMRYGASMVADQIRGLKRRNFWITEQTAGPTGVNVFDRAPRPGEIRSIAYQQLAHGADGMLWFRWRTCTVGRELNWHGLLGHDGRALRRYDEAARTAREFHQLWPCLQDSTPQARVAILFDFDSDQSQRIIPGYGGWDHIGHYVTHMHRYYDALLRAGVSVDIVPLNSDLTDYDLVLAPGLSVLPDEDAERLNAYVDQGGVFLCDVRSAVYDISYRCHPRTRPGLMAPVLGIEIPEYEGLRETQFPVRLDDQTYTATRLLDWVEVRGAEALARCQAPYLKDGAVLTRNAWGSGFGYYLGTIIEESAFYDRLIERLLEDAGVRPILKPPANVEVAIRVGPKGRIVFLMNHMDEEVEVSLPEGMESILTDTRDVRRMGSAVHLGPFAVAVYLLA